MTTDPLKEYKEEKESDREFFRQHRVQQQKIKADRSVYAVQKILAANLRYTPANHGTCLLFREPGKPIVDYYPTTGRWRVAGIATTYCSNVQSFINWYSKQKT